MVKGIMGNHGKNISAIEKLGGKKGHRAKKIQN